LPTPANTSRPLPMDEINSESTVTDADFTLWITTKRLLASGHLKPITVTSVRTLHRVSGLWRVSGVQKGGLATGRTPQNASLGEPPAHIPSSALSIEQAQTTTYQSTMWNPTTVSESGKQTD
jgi:hypothetical protein